MGHRSWAVVIKILNIAITLRSNGTTQHQLRRNDGSMSEVLVRGLNAECRLLLQRSIVKTLAQSSLGLTSILGLTMFNIVDISIQC